MQEWKLGNFFRVCLDRQGLSHDLPIPILNGLFILHALQLKRSAASHENK